MGWGYEGHFTVCKMAQNLLTNKTQTGVKALLPAHANGELAAVCSWPDEFRDLMPWSAALHYVNQPDNSCNYNYSRDCHDSAGIEGRCVTGAIYNYTEQLRSNVHNLNSSMKYNLTEALMFLSHFIGDVHQVWDDMIIEANLKTVYESDLYIFVQTLLADIVGSTNRSTWEECIDGNMVCADKYALESSELACQFAYKDVTPGDTLADEYFITRLPVMEERLSQVGVRLAATLNRIFSSTPSIS